MNVVSVLLKKDLFVSRRGIIISLLLVILFSTILQIGVIKIWAYSGETILDLKTNYSPDCAYKILYEMGDYGRGIYSYLNIIDFVFPFIYSMFLFTSIGYVLKKIYHEKRLLHQLMFIPFIVGIFDLFENVCIANIINEYPTRFDNLVKVANYFTIAKNVALVCTVIVLIGCIIVYFKKRK